MIVLNTGTRVLHELFDKATPRKGTIESVEHESRTDKLIIIDGRFHWDLKPRTNKRSGITKTKFPLKDKELEGVFYTIKYDIDKYGYGFETLFEDEGYLEELEGEN